MLNSETISSQEMKVRRPPPDGGGRALSAFWTAPSELARARTTRRLEDLQLMEEVEACRHYRPMLSALVCARTWGDLQLTEEAAACSHSGPAPSSLVCARNMRSLGTSSSPRRQKHIRILAADVPGRPGSVEPAVGDGGKKGFLFFFRLFIRDLLQLHTCAR